MNCTYASASNVFNVFCRYWQLVGPQPPAPVSIQYQVAFNEARRVAETIHDDGSNPSLLFLLIDFWPSFSGGQLNIEKISLQWWERPFANSKSRACGQSFIV